MESSLKFNYAEDRSKTGNNLLTTPSSTLIIFFTITKNGVFVKKIFDGVLTSFSDDKTSLKIEGSTDKVNSIITSYI